MYLKATNLSISLSTYENARLKAAYVHLYVANFIGNLQGFVSPQVTGLIINHHNDLHHWKIVFYIAAAIDLFGALIFVIFGSAEEQAWSQLGQKDADKRSSEEVTTKL